MSPAQASKGNRRGLRLPRPSSAALSAPSAPPASEPAPAAPAEPAGADGLAEALVAFGAGVLLAAALPSSAGERRAASRLTRRLLPRDGDAPGR